MEHLSMMIQLNKISDLEALLSIESNSSDWVTVSIESNWVLRVTLQNL